MRYQHVLLAPVGHNDHEHEGGSNLEEEQGEDDDHSEGRHHGVGLLQIIAHEIIRHIRVSSVIIFL